MKLKGEETEEHHREGMKVLYDFAIVRLFVTIIG